MQQYNNHIHIEIKSGEEEEELMKPSRNRNKRQAIGAIRLGKEEIELARKDAERNAERKEEEEEHADEYTYEEEEEDNDDYDVKMKEEDSEESDTEEEEEVNEVESEEESEEQEEDDETEDREDSEEEEDIELSDLIDSINPDKHSASDKVTKKDTVTSGKRLASLTQNLNQLQRIAREKKKGDIYFNVDQVDLELEERRAAFDLVDDKMVKWNSVVDYVQNARVIPVQYKEGHLEKRKRVVISKLNLKDDFTSNMEKILKQKNASMSEEQTEIPLYDIDENLAPGTKTLASKYEKLSKEELLERHREIAQKRKLMSYQKAKEARLKKIKSKTFRKIANKEKRKKEAEQELDEEELMKLDPEEARRRILEKERKYIQERLTLRHKNSSKWVKRAMKHSQHNHSLQGAISEQLKKGRELLTKQTTVANDSDEEDVLVEQMLSEDGKTEAFKQLREEIINEPEPEKGLFAMKFMKRAREKKKQEQMELIKEIEKDVELAREQFGTKSTGSDEEEEEKEAPMSRRIIGNKVTAKPVQSSIIEVKEPPRNEQAEGTLNSIPIPKEAQFTSLSSPQEEPKKTIVVTSISQKKRKRTVGVDNITNPWLNNNNKEKEGRQTKKQKAERESKETEIKVKVDESSLGLKNKKYQTKDSSKSAEDINFEKNIKKQAFAGDDLQLEFEEEKRKTIKEEVNLPNLAGKILPGWDSWVGNGTDWKNQLEENQRRVDLAKKKLLEQKEKERADNKLGHVIIRATAKLPDKYINKSLPPNEVPAKIHDNMNAHPLGSEWNSLIGFSENVKPRVQAKRGTIISPLVYDNAKTTMKWRRVQEEQKLNGGRTADIATRMDDEIEYMKTSEKSSYMQRKTERQAARERGDEEKQRSIKESFKQKLLENL